MKLRIATWNVNSVRQRLDLVKRLAAEKAPHVLCLQETKVEDKDFPLEPFVELGYRHILIHGMKSYNGVAIVSRVPLEKGGRKGWCGKDDCRHVFATLPGGIELHNVYVPSGGNIPDPKQNDKFAHKLQFMAEMAEWGAALRDSEVRRILVGDLNVAPLETDVWSHKQLLNVVSHTPVEVDHLSGMMAAHGWVDAVRHFIPPKVRLYSWWSYRARDWSASDRGRRLDHIWVSPPLTPGLESAEVLREARGWETPSDHVPVILTLKI